MSGHDHRKLAGDLATMITDTLGDRAPGLLLVVVANESESQPGRLEVDAACRGINAHTELGCKLLEQLGDRLKAAVRQAGADGGVLVERPDLVIPGTRGDS